MLVLAGLDGFSVRAGSLTLSVFFLGVSPQNSVMKDLGFVRSLICYASPCWGSCLRTFFLHWCQFNCLRWF